MSALEALQRVRVTPEPRPVYCVVEHLHRDRAVAEAACAGRFSHLGVTVELGTEPDWTGADLPADDEWRISWSKFYAGLDLAHAFRQTGETRFLRAWERLMSSWIEQVPVGSGSSDVAARRVQNWIYAWQRFASAPAYEGLADELAERIRDGVAEQTEFVAGNLTPARNHRTLELYTLFLVPLAFPELDPDRILLDRAVGDLHENLVTDVLPDGVHCERSTHYHLLVLRTFLGVRENARRFGVQLPAGFDERLELACEFAVHCRRPDGEIPALSDSDAGSYAELIDLAASLFERPDFLFAATRGAHGTRPRRRNVSFPLGGYHVQRSGWEGADERYLIFDCGPLGEGGHGHYDALSFEAYALGQPLVVDPGRYTYAEEPGPNWRRWFKGTAAHNTVCVDGLDQTPYRRRKPAGPVAEAGFLGRVRRPGLDVLCGRVVSPCYDAVHTRRIVFVAGEYWLIEDRLEGERLHRYDLRFHLAPAAEGAVEMPTGATVVRAPGAALVFPTGYEPRLEGGWFAPLYGTKLPAPVVSVAVKARSARFLTLLAPMADGARVPRLVERSRGGRVQVEVTRGRAVDVVTWGAGSARLERSSAP